jgi:hypothetical protein
VLGLRAVLFSGFRRGTFWRSLRVAGRFLNRRCGGGGGPGERTE